MAGERLGQIDELWARRRASRHGHTIHGNEKLETSTFPVTYLVSRLAEEGRRNRGNDAMQISARHSMQRIHGNRAVQRSLSIRQDGYGRKVGSVTSVPVQRQDVGGYYDGDCYVGPSGARVCGGPIQVDGEPSEGGGHYEGDCYVGPSGSRVCGGPIEVDGESSSEGSPSSQAPQPQSPAIEMPPLEVTPGGEQSWWDRIAGWF
jgi:hypothetical protein